MRAAARRAHSAWAFALGIQNVQDRELTAAEIQGMGYDLDMCVRGIAALLNELVSDMDFEVEQRQHDCLCSVTMLAKLVRPTATGLAEFADSLARHLKDDEPPVPGPGLDGNATHAAKNGGKGAAKS
ncbi:MAG: hypothetical protein F4X97_09855 [Boseongicola sp. SB0662_bin_57]|nr:hypothetical protein [Boseongicola sp. SB0662_bin_57]